MKIAFIHYHLKTGGVTTVLRQQVEVIKDACDVLVLTGEPLKTPFPAETAVIHGLGYDGTYEKNIDPEGVAESAIRAIHSKWENGCDLVHVHNPTLAKNRNFLKILNALQKRNINLFLQIHDFAEDGRPLVYFSEEYVSDCHYGVINSRDYNILLQAGLVKDGVHKIFNTINPLSGEGLCEIPITNQVLYPIRALRRKNIGEAILLSRFFRNNEILSITLPPNSPIDIQSYQGWKDYVKENNLNVVFEAGLHNEFARLVLSSKFLITTSISEGFGFSFLEPWTAKKMLWGRNLADISCDFEENGIQLDHLYAKFRVPTDWIGKNRLFEKWKSCLLSSCEKINCPIDTENIVSSFAKAAVNDQVDFGLLDEAFQKQIISRVIPGKKDAKKLIELNPFLVRLGDLSGKDALIETNMDAVLRNYNKSIYMKKLIDIYTNVVNKPVRHRINKKRLLSRFLSPENFSLLKWSDNEI